MVYLHQVLDQPDRNENAKFFSRNLFLLFQISAGLFPRFMPFFGLLISPL